MRSIFCNITFLKYPNSRYFLKTSGWYLRDGKEHAQPAPGGQEKPTGFFPCCFSCAAATREQNICTEVFMAKGGDGWSSLDLPIFSWYLFHFIFMVFQYFLSTLKGIKYRCESIKDEK